jgi:hypothetical protein
LEFSVLGFQFLANCLYLVAQGVEHLSNFSDARIKLSAASRIDQLQVFRNNSLRVELSQ